MSRSLSISYISHLLVLVFMESSIRTVYIYPDFFLMCKLYNFGVKIMYLISDHLTFMDSVDVEDC